MSKEIKEKTRAKAARHHDIVLAAMEENMSMLASNIDPFVQDRTARVFELLDELRRSLRKKGVNGDVEGAA